ncbi:MAG: hypothetical protein V3Q69_12930 [Burkholderia sp.]
MTFTRNGLGASPYQVRFQSNCLIFAKKIRKDLHNTGKREGTLPCQELGGL